MRRQFEKALENIANELSPNYEGRLIVSGRGDCVNCDSHHDYFIMERKGRLWWAKEGEQVFAVNYVITPYDACIQDRPDVHEIVCKHLQKYAEAVERTLALSLKGQYGHSTVRTFSDLKFPLNR